MLPEANSGAYCLFSPFLQTVSDSPPLSPRFFANFSRRRDKERKRERRGGGRGTQVKDHSHTYKQNEGLQFGGLEIVANT